MTKQLTCNDCHKSYSPTGGHCTVCHESFTGDESFDAHRVGAYEPDERYCRTYIEMEAKGFVRNWRGYWQRNRDDRKVPEHWTSS